VQILAKQRIILPNNIVCAISPDQSELLLLSLVAIVFSGCLFESFIFDKVSGIVSFKD